MDTRSDKPRKPHMGDLRQVVDHFLYYLSNEPDKSGISPRMRFYGMLPVQAKMLLPDVDDEVFTKAVNECFELIRRQRSLI